MNIEEATLAQLRKDHKKADLEFHSRLSQWKATLEAGDPKPEIAKARRSVEAARENLQLIKARMNRAAELLKN